MCVLLDQYPNQYRLPPVYSFIHCSTRQETDEDYYVVLGFGLQLPHKLPAVPFWEFIALYSSEVNRGVPVIVMVPCV